VTTGNLAGLVKQARCVSAARNCSTVVDASIALLSERLQVARLEMLSEKKYISAAARAFKAGRRPTNSQTGRPPTATHPPARPAKNFRGVGRSVHHCIWARAPDRQTAAGVPSPDKQTDRHGATCDIVGADHIRHQHGIGVVFVPQVHRHMANVWPLPNASASSVMAPAVGLID
jgi:hypothetical protein